MAREIYWHLPGFCSFRLLNQILMNLMKDYPECFMEGYKIGSVYGTFPGAIWNGGRAVLGSAGKQEMEAVLRIYNDRGIPVRFTWTNGLLEAGHLEDAYCNQIMELADNGLNQALVNAPLLEAYLRERYPSYKLISSTTKRITGTDGLLGELEKDYFLVVLDYDLNHDRQTLEAVGAQAGRVEILVNEICFPGCVRRTAHYRHQSLVQLGRMQEAAALAATVRSGIGQAGGPASETCPGMSRTAPGAGGARSAEFPCPHRTHQRSFEDCGKRPAFLSNEEIASYADLGFVHFKIMGRGMPESFVRDAYLYYLVKEERREWIREKIDGLLARFSQAMSRRV